MNRSEFRLLEKEYGTETAKAIEAEIEFLTQTRKAVNALKPKEFLEQFERAVHRACNLNAEYKFYLPYKFKLTRRAVKYFLPTLYIKKIIRKMNARTVFLQKFRMNVAGRIK